MGNEGDGNTHCIWLTMTIPTTVWIRSLRILRRVLEIWGNLLSLRLQWKTYKWHNNWVTASLLKSPGLFSVFCPFSIMLLFGWFPLGRQFPNPPGRLINIFENGQNTEKSPGELKRLAVPQSSVKDHQLTLIWKTRMRK